MLHDQLFIFIHLKKEVQWRALLNAIGQMVEFAAQQSLPLQSDCDTGLPSTSSLKKPAADHLSGWHATHSTQSTAYLL
jgi:hypothetical protein